MNAFELETENHSSLFISTNVISFTFWWNADVHVNLLNLKNFQMRTADDIFGTQLEIFQFTFDRHRKRQTSHIEIEQMVR